MLQLSQILRDGKFTAFVVSLVICRALGPPVLDSSSGFGRIE